MVDRSVLDVLNDAVKTAENARASAIALGNSLIPLLWPSGLGIPGAGALKFELECYSSGGKLQPGFASIVRSSGNTRRLIFDLQGNEVRI